MGDIFFVRHGQTDWNEDDRLRGWSLIPLNAEGRKEAQQAAQELKSQHIIHILASDLPRVMETAKPISKATGAPITIDNRLRDFDYGDWTGVPVKDVLPKMLAIFKAQEGTPPGGEEDYSDMLDRTHQIIDILLRQAKVSGKQNYAVVSNNRLARIYLAYISGNDKWITQTQDPIGNSGILRFSLHDNLPGQGEGVGEGKPWGWEEWNGGRKLGFKEE